MHGSEHVFGDGVGHAAADGRTRGGLGCIACVFGRVAVAETLEHGDIVAAISVNRNLVLGNTVVAASQATLSPLLHATSVISNITGSNGALTTRSERSAKYALRSRSSSSEVTRQLILHTS